MRRGEEGLLASCLHWAAGWIVVTLAVAYWVAFRAKSHNESLEDWKRERDDYEARGAARMRRKDRRQ